MATSAVTKKSRRRQFKPLTADQAASWLAAVRLQVQDAKQVLATAEPTIVYLEAVVKSYEKVN